MRVALTYNLKGEVPAATREDAAPSAEVPVEGEEPPLPPDFFAECDSVETVSAIQAALSSQHHVELIEANEDAFERFRKSRPDIVFNVAEGIHGTARESHVPAMLEMLRIPYTGSDPLSLAISLDKARTKEALAYHGIPVPRTLLVSSMAEMERVRRQRLPFGFPVIVKPVAEGSSKGIVNDAIVRNYTELEEQVRRVVTLYHQAALVEPFLEGREFTVAMIGNGDGVECLPIVEVLFDTLPKGVNRIYSYEAKWIWDTAKDPLEIFRCPADVSPELKREIERICVGAFTALRLRDWARIDVRCDQQAGSASAAGQPYVLEVNPLPGILPKTEDNSCFPKAARAAGMTYDEMILRVLDTASRRYGLL